METTTLTIRGVTLDYRVLLTVNGEQQADLGTLREIFRVGDQR